MNKSFHNFLMGVSVLPALVVAPAMADGAPGIGFVDNYVTETVTQLHSVLANQNSTGFEIGKITIGTDMSSVNGDSLRYKVDSRDVATQYIKMENVSMPEGFGDMYLNMPLDANFGYGIAGFELDIMETALGTEIETADGYAKPRVADAVNLLNSMISTNIIHERTWILGTVGSVISDGGLGEGYLYTDNNFVVDGQYGNMAKDLIETYRESLEGMLDELADVDSMTAQQIADKMSIKLGTVALKASMGDDFVATESLAKTAGGMIFRDAFGITSEAVAAKWKSGDLETALSTYLTQIENGLVDLGSLKMNVGEVTMNGGNVTFKNAVNLTSNNVAINAGNVTVDTGANLTLAGANLKIADGAVVTNNGTLNVNSTNVEVNEDLVGSGTLVIGENTTLNIGTNSIDQTKITLDGTMNATLRSGNPAQFNVTTFDGDGKLNLTFTGEGTYNLFGGTGVFITDVSNSVYDITWADDNKSFEATVKSAANIAKESEITKDAASAVAGLSESTSEKLNELAVKMQEKLAEGTPEAKEEVEHIAKAIHPETESVVQSVATSVQTTVANLASARMATPVAGRNAGDVDFTSGGVWAQGLYNKSKKDDAFDGSTRGVALGVDGTINKDWMIGAGYSYADSDINGTERDTDIKSNTVFLYGQYKPAEWYVNAMLNYTWSEYSEETSLAATADYDVTSFGGAVAAGYDFESGVTPELGLRYIHINGETYTDSMDVKSELESGDYLTAMLGAKYGFDIAADEDMLFRPEVRAAVKYDIVSDKTLATVIMPGVSAYTLDGDRLSRIGGEFGIGLTMNYKELDVSLNYDIEVREDYTSQTGMLKFRYNF